MKSICRVYISDPSALRSFYWFQYAADHSIYFGTSNSKHFRTGYAGTLRSSATAGTRVDYTRDGRPMTSEELKQKTSIHGSGVVNVRTLADGTRQRYRITAPRDGFAALPIVAIFPMHPSSYPISAKPPKPTDLIIQTAPDSPLPFGSIFYLTRTDGLEPPTITGAKSRYPIFANASIPFGPGRLCVSIYGDPSRLNCWPQLEATVLALPELPGGEPSWPFFG